MNLAELIYDNARRCPHRQAVAMGDISVDYAGLWRESDRIAQEMAERGVGRGDRVLLYADNCPEAIIVYLAAARLGAIFAPVHSSFKARELEYVLKNSRAQILFAEETLLRRIDDDLTLRALRPPSVVTIGSWPGAVRARHGTAGASARRDTAMFEASSHDPVLVTYTSGSNSRMPTPVTRSHGGEIWNARTYADVWDLRHNDRVLISLPLSWVYGLTTVGLSALAAGATVVLQPADGSTPLLPAIDDHKITVFAGTMTMYSRLLAELQERHHDHSSLRRLYVGGESVVEPIVQLIEHYTGIRPLQAYATTEVAPVLAVDPVRDVSPPTGTAGHLVRGSAIRLVDPSGHDVPDGQVGEAWLRSRGSMLGYWNEPALTAARMTSDGWFRSGDYLWRNPDGYFFMVGRDEDVIIREGAKVSVSEVEAALADLDGIEDAVVVGLPDEEFGAAVIAFVVLESGSSTSIDSIYDELGSKIARFKLPREIYRLDEIPLGFTGKRDRRHLRELAQAPDTTSGSVIRMADWLAARSRNVGVQRSGSGDRPDLHQ